ncbi:hypothetical protein FOCC_FOCC016891 [Frankliniella occidentalis]|nr:hypothetical protein FOCC_FOCC016891 [Frankliniella occidentalis]
MKTRKQEEEEYMLGSPQEMSGRVLPTRQDAMRFYYFVRLQKKAELRGFDPPMEQVVQVVADRVEEIWTKASIPIVSNRSIVLGLSRYVQNCRKVAKNWKNPSPRVQEGVQSFIEESKKLFDVAQCKCLPAKPLCVCSPTDVISSVEVPFLVDQRTDRRMVIGGVDKGVTRVLQRAEEKVQKRVMAVKEVEERSSATTFSLNIGKKLQALCSKAAAAGTSATSASDPEWRPPSPVRPSSSCSSSSSSSRNTLALPTACRVAERFNLPSGAAAALATAVLKDAGVVKPEDTSLVVDRKKFSRQRQKFRSVTRENELRLLRETELLGLYFDGRQDKTQVREELPNHKIRLKTISEEHVVLLAEPGDVYLGHVTPPDHSADTLANTLLDFLENANIETTSLRCVGCDGTNTNTGCWNGAIRRLEESFGRPLQWHVCLLHANELPLRHTTSLRCVGCDGTNTNTGCWNGAIWRLEESFGRPLQWHVCLLHANELPQRHVMETFDGPTSGPTTWSGPIGQQLKSCLDMPVVKLQAITLELPDEDLDSSSLSTDQKYTLDMARAISTGNCSPELAARNPGIVNHSSRRMKDSPLFTVEDVPKKWRVNCNRHNEEENVDDDFIESGPPHPPPVFVPSLPVIVGGRALTNAQRFSKFLELCERAGRLAALHGGAHFVKMCNVIESIIDNWENNSDVYMARQEPVISERPSVIVRKETAASSVTTGNIFMDGMPETDSTTSPENGSVHNINVSEQIHSQSIIDDRTPETGNSTSPENGNTEQLVTQAEQSGESSPLKCRCGLPALE